MSGYEQRLAADKNEIRTRVSEIGERVHDAVVSAVDALLRRDEAACARVMLGDLPINREIRAIDKLCHAFVARHLPSAGHLRFVSSVLQMNVAIERIGDYAVTIAREGVQLTTLPPADISNDMRTLAAEGAAMLRNAITAFAQRDADLARKTKPHAKTLERSYAHVFRELVRHGSQLPLADAFAVLTVFHRLERVSDQAKNICEETLFELTGETKPPKQYQVLFVGAGNTLVAPLAVALARKAFPESGVYASAGYAAGEALSPALEQLAGELGLDLTGMTPAPLDSGREALEQYHVIVCISSEARAKIKEVPFATAILVWELPRLSQLPTQAVKPQLHEFSQFLAAQIRELMVTLRGEGAS
jgi:phosphate transport system protein